MEWITFGIAVAGFLMSLATWILTFLSQRKNIGIRITECKSDDEITLCFVHIENKSRLPIAITRIVLLSGENEVDCVPFPTWVLDDTRRSGKEIISRKSYYSMQMPIAISALGAVSGYVLFQSDQRMLPDDAKLLNLKVAKHEKVAIYGVNQRISNVCRIAGAAKLRSNPGHQIQ